MKLLASLALGANAAGVYVEKNEASEFLQRQGRANTGMLTEEFRTGDLERECHEEQCSWDEAMEIFEDKTATDQFMNAKLNMCENKLPCFAEGSTGNCKNKWGNYWCECRQDWYGKDCDYIDVGGSFTCQNPAGCHNAFGPPKVVAEPLEEQEEMKDEEEVNPMMQPFVSEVNCDVVEDKFVIHLPPFEASDLMMGLSLDTATCGPTEITERGATYSYSFNDCGTRLTVMNDVMIYDNHIGRGPLITRGVIRDYGVTYNARCVVDRLGHVDNFETEPVYGPNGELINGTGTILPVYTLTDALMKEMSVENDSHFIFRLNVYRDGQFSAKFSPAEFPLVRHFKERVYLGVETMTKLDYQYLFTQACWATPDADPARRSSVYYPFIADGCPVDEYTSLSPRLDLEDRFSTQTFKFQDSSFVYIQCDVIVCDLRVPNDPECQSTCRNDDGLRQTRSTVERSRRAVVSDKVREIVTVGPLEVFKPSDDEHTRQSAHSSSGGSFGWIAAGVACTAFVAYIVYQKRDHHSNEISPEVL